MASGEEQVRDRLKIELLKCALCVVQRSEINVLVPRLLQVQVDIVVRLLQVNLHHIQQLGVHVADGLRGNQVLLQARAKQLERPGGFALELYLNDVRIDGLVLIGRSMVRVLLRRVFKFKRHKQLDLPVFGALGQPALLG